MELNGFVIVLVLVAIVVLVLCELQIHHVL